MPVTGKFLKNHVFEKWDIKAARVGKTLSEAPNCANDPRIAIPRRFFILPAENVSIKTSTNSKSIPRKGIDSRNKNRNIFPAK
jgi:hypothetical protein